MNPSENTLKILTYLCSKRGGSSVTELMKLCYLSDLVSVKKKGQQLSNFSYVRYNYGPFDEKIYLALKNLAENRILDASPAYTQTGNEYIAYSVNPEHESHRLENLSDDEVIILDEILEAMKGHGAKALTEVAYKTAPMAALGATLGGNENLNTTLDLTI